MENDEKSYKNRNIVTDLYEKLYDPPAYRTIYNRHVEFYDSYIPRYVPGKKGKKQIEELFRFLYVEDVDIYLREAGVSEQDKQVYHLKMYVDGYKFYESVFEVDKLMHPVFVVYCTPPNRILKNLHENRSCGLRWITYLEHKHGELPVGLQPA